MTHCFETLRYKFACNVKPGNFSCSMNLSKKIFSNASALHNVFLNICVKRSVDVTRCRFKECSSSLEFLSTYSKVGLNAAQLKKQVFKKKTTAEHEKSLNISAFSAAEEFDMSTLVYKLECEPRYKFTEYNEFFDANNVVHMLLEVSGEPDPKDVFVFREGSVVLWNFDEKETADVLQFLKGFHIDSFSEQIVESENESLPYIRSPDSTKTSLRQGKVILHPSENETLDKFAISNAMALSVHLGAYEALLNDYINSMLPVTEDLKTGKNIKMSKKDVLMKMGQLFALRHVINLSSDLLDTPDFYWDREELEKLYQRTFNYFCITRRTKVMNEKINHCIELVELLSTQLSDAHHIRLEWMIIILIMVEVGFEVSHYLITYL